MCGIAGFIDRPGTRETRTGELAAMTAAILHRGPDEEGSMVTDRVALGMRRLSIIDLSGGSQPISNEDGSVHVVFNGEIYNFAEIRSELEAAGHRFETRSDTEILVHSYEEYGLDLTRRLRGMFAFALWDSARERLVVVRDRLGIKPLYYWESREAGLAFASELRSLRALDGFPTEIEPAAMADYLSLGYVPDPATIYRGVRKLPPGHHLVWTRERGATIERYWSPIVEERTDLTEEEAAAEVRRLLLESVRYRLVADVPLGAFLSGGVDSSAIVAAMARQMDRPVKTFSIGFEERDFNEAPDARRVSEALGTEHTELIVRPEVDALVERVVDGFGEPFADSSAIPTLLVSELARQHVTVSLSGDGGDELFGGYTRYHEVAARDVWLPAPFRTGLRAVARRLPHAAYGRNRLLELSRSTPGRYAGQIGQPLDIAEGGVARPEVAAAGHRLETLVDRWWGVTEGRSLLSRLTLVDAQSYLPGDILTKVDRMSMAVSLEARVPVLDHHLAEFAFSLPASMKWGTDGGKMVFRRALEGLVPSFVFTKPKHGFGVPLRDWFRNELSGRCDEILAPGARLHEFVDPVAARRVIDEHRSKRRDHSHMIWRLLVLQLWLERRAEPVARRTAPADRRQISATA
ncbi:MAG: asparagine synthase (glutamine-hydrolyzing) [Gemmatimonadetes bacterium]|nr:asparagine synthase (glutamine-hydrolyzing) [Gemmatimonadota bacterium]